MKIFTSMLVMLLFASWALAQNAPINFETGGHGATWVWNVFENGPNPPPLEIVANPNPAGINTSSTVARFTARQAGQPWAGTESVQGHLGEFTWNENNRIVRIMVWKSVISDVGIKFDTGTPPNDWSSGEIRVRNTLVNQWEELTFDFSNVANPPAHHGGLKRIIVFPDFASRTQDNVVFFDNITFHPSAVTPPTITVPAAAAPAPTFNPQNVISLHAQGYPSVPVDTWRTSWSAAAYEEVMIAGRPTKRYSSLNFVGIETIANQINITGMTHLHMNVWSHNFSSFGIKLVDFGANGSFGGGDDTEHELFFPNQPLGQWVSLAIPLSDFTNLRNRRNIAQIILVGRPAGVPTVFVDNILFHNLVPTSVENITEQNIRVFPNPVVAGNPITIDTDVKSVEVVDFSGRVVYRTNSSVIDTGSLDKGFYILRIQTLDGNNQNRKLMVK